jgi:nucleotide-binding universal stress UspA family protein
MIVLKNLLVATDFSAPAAVALAYGRDLAHAYHARVHLLHVIEDVLMRYSPEVAYAAPELQRDLEIAARRHLAALTTEDDRTLSIIPAVETGTNVASSIVAYAKANDVDLIIAGTHGRGAVQHLLMGSVAERVVRTAPCPVLTVHAKERDFITADAMVATAKR